MAAEQRPLAEKAQEDAFCKDALAKAQEAFIKAVVDARKVHGSADDRVQQVVTDAMWPYFIGLGKHVFGGDFHTDSKLREKERKAYLDAMNDKARIATMSPSYWLGSVFLPYGFNIPQEDKDCISCHKMTTEEVLHYALAAALDGQTTFILTIQPDN